MHLAHCPPQGNPSATRHIIIFGVAVIESLPAEVKGEARFEKCPREPGSFVK